MLYIHSYTGVCAYVSTCDIGRLEEWRVAITYMKGEQVLSVFLAAK